jgi:hypothetical protein
MCRTYTAWGLWALLATIVSIRGVIAMRNNGALDRSAKYDLLDKAHNLVTAVAASESLLLTIFYWAALYKPGDTVRHLAAACCAKQGIMLRLQHLCAKFCKPSVDLKFWPLGNCSLASTVEISPRHLERSDTCCIAD